MATADEYGSAAGLPRRLRHTHAHAGGARSSHTHPGTRDAMPPSGYTNPNLNRNAGAANHHGARRL
ncbi:MAG TPA: hypothetical protein PLT26_17060 [Anaerolineaceae bacterium]|nr:hypothetical protein [Anaerolineaceae bacterium]HQH87168.1 hypothetical protein [Anaerolineaceae bacterium]